MKPILCLDVDGVLCPFTNPGGYQHVPTGEGDWVWISRDNAARLALLAEHYKLVWATAWEHRANRYIAPLHELPPLPVIEWDWSQVRTAEAFRTGLDWKLPFIAEYCEGRPFAWIDDEIAASGFAWAAQREPETLFVQPKSSVGFTNDHFHELVDFAKGLRHGATHANG